MFKKDSWKVLMIGYEFGIGLFLAFYMVKGSMTLIDLLIQLIKYKFFKSTGGTPI